MQTHQHSFERILSVIFFLEKAVEPRLERTSPNHYQQLPFLDLRASLPWLTPSLTIPEFLIAISTF